jgi:hypothetical protein
MGVEGSSHGLISGTILAFSWRDSKTTENLRRGGWYPNQDLNQESPEYSLNHYASSSFFGIRIKFRSNIQMFWENVTKVQEAVT